MEKEQHGKEKMARRIGREREREGIKEGRNNINKRKEKKRIGSIG